MEIRIFITNISRQFHMLFMMQQWNYYIGFKWCHLVVCFITSPVEHILAVQNTTYAGSKPLSPVLGHVFTQAL